MKTKLHLYDSKDTLVTTLEFEGNLPSPQIVIRDGKYYTVCERGWRMPPNEDNYAEATNILTIDA